jgi:hypothetical protein
MVLSRGPHKVERVKVTFTPTAGDEGFRNIPSTFSPESRTYAWKRLQKMEYLIVPRKISNNQVVVEMFFETRQGKVSASEIQKTIQELVQSKIQSDWQGLKLAGISRVTTGAPPDQRFVRGTIEEILGARLEKS